jgi:DNA repair exonuclease SbcCD ATPase subunit
MSELETRLEEMESLRESLPAMAKQELAALRTEHERIRQRIIELAPHEGKRGEPDNEATKEIKELRPKLDDLWAKIQAAKNTRAKVQREVDQPKHAERLANKIQRQEAERRAKRLEARTQEGVQAADSVDAEVGSEGD